MSSLRFFQQRRLFVCVQTLAYIQSRPTTAAATAVDGQAAKTTAHIVAQASAQVLAAKVPAYMAALSIAGQLLQ